MKLNELKDFLDEKAELYNVKSYIESDPIQIPHRFELRQDIEIAGFLVATISWGNRKSIINSADKMLNLMDHSPFDFVQNATDQDLAKLNNISVHRTFKGEYLAHFIFNLRRIYSEHHSLENLFVLQNSEENFYHALERFRQQFLLDANHRSKKHVSSTYKNASAKRLIMFLRWMVRSDKKGVDFGIWRTIDPRFLSVPLDVHTGNIGRKLSIIQRKQNDWKTVEEMDSVLRKFCPEDPAKYDFALFGLGISKDF